MSEVSETATVSSGPAARTYHLRGRALNALAVVAAMAGVTLG
jgi:hypothetical protein